MGRKKKDSIVEEKPKKKKSSKKKDTTKQTEIKNKGFLTAEEYDNFVANEYSCFDENPYDKLNNQIYNDFIQKHHIKKLKQDKKKPDYSHLFKVCKCCNEEKSLNEFNLYYNKDKQSHMDICKECEKDKSKKSHSKKKDILSELKSCGCVVCGENDPCCIDFHHIDNEHKEFNMGAAWSKPDRRIIEEAAKCVVVCANCHRKIHSNTIDIFDYVNPAQYQYLRKLLNIVQNCSETQIENFAKWPHNDDDDGNIK